MRCAEKIGRCGVLVVVLAMTLAVAVPMLAGNPSPSGPPSNPGSRFTLGDIYLRLTTGAPGNASPHTGPFMEPAAGPPTSPVHTVDQIIQVAPSLDSANGATPAQVLSGKTFWGLQSGGGWGPQTGTMATQTAAQPGRTGQTSCWDTSGTLLGSCAGTGQDGELQKGVAWPNPRFTRNGNGTVTDNLTKLIWLQNAGCKVFFSGDATGSNARPWAAALTAAASLASMYCGLSDGSVAGAWRLPNRFEQESLLDLQYSNPPLSNVEGTGPCILPTYCAFTNVLTMSWYWTSSTYAYSASFAWFVNLFDGLASGSDKTIGLNSVWPVRGGQ